MNKGMLLEHRINLKEFHGHLGPYAVIGYKMGMLALELLKARGKDLKAHVKTGSKPPLSCVVDGIQFSTPCTLGKGNISISDDKTVEAVFTGEKQITIRLKDSARQSIDSTISNGEQTAISVWNMESNELFEVL